MSATQIIHRLINTANISLVISGKDMLLIGMSKIKFLSKQKKLSCWGFSWMPFPCTSLEQILHLDIWKTSSHVENYYLQVETSQLGKVMVEGQRSWKLRMVDCIFNIVLRRLRQEDCQEFEVSLGNIERLCLRNKKKPHMLVQGIWPVKSKGPGRKFSSDC